MRHGTRVKRRRGYFARDMGTKAQHSAADEPLRAIPRSLREGAGLTQRGLGEQLGRPQGWVHNWEVGNRRVNVAEFAESTTACGVEPGVAFARLLAEGTGRKPRPPKPGGSRR